MPQLLPSTVVTRFIGTTFRRLPNIHQSILAVTLVWKYSLLGEMIGYPQFLLQPSRHAMFSDHGCPLKEVYPIPLSQILVSSRKDTVTDNNTNITWLNHFKVSHFTACRFLCIRLTHFVTSMRSMLDSLCGGPTYTIQSPMWFRVRTFTSGCSTLIQAHF